MARPSTCMSEVWMSNQKSASDVEPGALLVETWNASIRGIALMVMATMVAVTRTTLRCKGGSNHQFTEYMRWIHPCWSVLTFWCVLSDLAFLVALSVSFLSRKKRSND